MENPIYLYDFVAVIVLVTGTFLVWRRFLGRMSSDAKWCIGPIAAAIAILVAFLLLHVWAQIRPIPVSIQKVRSLTGAEQEKLATLGWPAEYITNAGAFEIFPLNKTNGVGINETDIRAIKQLLAWKRLSPLFPKNLTFYENKSTLTPQETEWKATAAYKWRGYLQKQVYFRKQKEGWELTYIKIVETYGPEPTNTWDRIAAWMPIDFKN